MNSNSGLKIAILVVLAGVGFGAYRMLGESKPSLAKPVTDSGNAYEPTVAQPAPDAKILTLLTSSSKEKLLKKVADAYNSQNPGVFIQIESRESREGLQAILSGSIRPDLYSPSDSPMTESLNAAWKKKNGGRSLVNTGSPDSDLMFAETPCVFLTTTRDADRLDPILRSEKPFAAVMREDWIRFSIANPISSASGLLALGRIQKEAPGSIRKLKSKLIYDSAAISGSTQLLEAYLSELRSKGTSPRSFIIAYETKAIDAMNDNPDLSLKIIYPIAANVAEQRMSVLEGPNSEEAKQFVKFLRTPEAQQILISEGFHPRFVRDTLSTPSYETSPPQPYSDLMKTAAEWNRIAGN